MEHQHFKLFKPYGYLCQFVYYGKGKKGLLGELYDFPEGTMSIGRLDEASEGLLILTTDGKMSEAVRSKTVEKEYYAQVDGLITDEAIEGLKQGVDISINGEIYHTLPAKVKKIHATPNLPKRARKIRDDRHGPTSWVSITVTEGKYRQVRKMTAVVGFPTLRLVRVRIADITIEGMESGSVEVLKTVL
ncbi:MAG: pseudouridine synthase [Putridiphycobacter sp.]